MVSTRSLLGLTVILFPIVVGSVFTSIGALNFLEITQPRPVASLPAYGFLPFGSFDFTPTRLQISLHRLSLKDGFADGLIELEFRLTGPTWGEQIFGFQIPHKIENVGYKMGGLYPNGSEAILEISYKELTTRNDTSIAYCKFTALPDYSAYYIIVEFRWRDIIDKRDFYSYDVECPFQISQDNNVVEEQLPGVWIQMMHHEGLTLNYRIAMPPGSRLQSSIPPPEKEEVYWLGLQGETKQYRFITFSQNVHFGRLSQLPELNCFRVTLELTEEKERYEKLLFNSGLFLGLGVSLILSGVYETIKYEKDRKME